MNILEIRNKIEDLFKEKGYYEDFKETLFLEKYSALHLRLNLIEKIQRRIFQPNKT